MISEVSCKEARGVGLDTLDSRVVLLCSVVLDGLLFALAAVPQRILESAILLKGLFALLLLYASLDVVKLLKQAATLLRVAGAHRCQLRLNRLLLRFLVS